MFHLFLSIMASILHMIWYHSCMLLKYLYHMSCLSPLLFMTCTVYPMNHVHSFCCALFCLYHSSSLGYMTCYYTYWVNHTGLLHWPSQCHVPLKCTLKDIDKITCTKTWQKTTLRELFMSKHGIYLLPGGWFDSKINILALMCPFSGCYWLNYFHILRTSCWINRINIHTTS